ncbi:hypothetical protein C8R44DRAFT_891835 [Mycena epipterygia]|nr:hypothetical protein C8R44DRAFT_891835 [Mycena epipterygia]
MSILVDSVHTSSVTVSSERSGSILSNSFVRSQFPAHRSSSPFAFTINGGPHGSFTVVLPCTVSSNMAADVSLGLDWTSSVREWYIGLGLSPANGFDARDHLRADRPGSSSPSDAAVNLAARSGYGSIDGIVNPSDAQFQYCYSTPDTDGCPFVCM